MTKTSLYVALECSHLQWDSDTLSTGWNLKFLFSNIQMISLCFYHNTLNIRYWWDFNEIREYKIEINNVLADTQNMTNVVLTEV